MVPSDGSLPAGNSITTVALPLPPPFIVAFYILPPHHCRRHPALHMPPPHHTATTHHTPCLTCLAYPVLATFTFPLPPPQDTRTPLPLLLFHRAHLLVYVTLNIWTHQFPVYRFVGLYGRLLPAVAPAFTLDGLDDYQVLMVQAYGSG